LVLVQLPQIQQLLVVHSILAAQLAQPPVLVENQEPVEDDR
jgi:hypothetical protein